MTRAIAAAALLAACACVRADEWSQMIGQTDQVTQGLVAYYAMRTSGATVLDEWGALPATATNSAAFGYDFGVVGNGAYLGGTNQHIWVLSASVGPTAFTGAGSFSVSAWAKATSTSKISVICRGGGGAPYFGWGMWVDRFGIIDTTPTPKDYLPSGDVVTGQWVFCAGVYVAHTSASFYQNGQLKQTVNTDASVTIRSSAVSTNINIGAYLPSDFFLGDIDEVRIYNRALSADEIRQLYRMGATPRRIKE